MSNFNLNKVILGGRLTNDVELKKTQQGTSVATFTIAVNRKTSKDQEQQADFINCQAWRNTAEFIGKYFSKGSSICILGSLKTRSWKDNDGKMRYATDIEVNEVNFVDSKGEDTTHNQNASQSEFKYVPQAYTQPNFEAVATDDSLPF